MALQQQMFSPGAGLLSRDDFIVEIANANFPIYMDNRGKEWYNIPAAFDIEVSSFEQEGEKRACMYVWQFGIWNYVTYGRTWQEFKALLSVVSTILSLSEDRVLTVFVHNLPYEFQFMRKWFDWDKLFFLDERKPVYAIYGGIQFRCSLKLSSKSLERVGKDLQKYKVEKMVGDLDYSLIRTSATPLTEKELGYCENDIRVLLAYIQEKIEQDGNITAIPLTNTGYVRNFCRKSCLSRFKQYKGIMDNLTLSPEEYKMLKRGFAGGFTHANYRYSGEVLEKVGSFDFTSSYPAVMLAEKFPMSSAIEVNAIENSSQLEFYLRNFCCLIDITFENLVPKADFDHPISVSKCFKVRNAVTDNGRIVTASSLTTTCTEQDFYVYSQFYSWDNMEIHRMLVYKKGYLPKPFVKAILKMYSDKTRLKGVDGEEVNYMISKNMLNSAYGMTVTDIVRETVEYSDDSYSTVKPDIVEAIEAYNKAVKRFLFYPWGVWVTAYARANLFSGILACGDDYIYSDTDSIKILNPEKHMDYINRYNAQIEHKLEKAAEFHGLDVAEFSPCNKKGEPKPIGVWDFEGIYDKFKTIGAKRYMTLKNGKYSLTVAGVNKSKAMEYILVNYKDPFDGLSGELVVPKEYSGRLTLSYVDEERAGIVTDYLGNVARYYEKSYIHMAPSDYSLTLSEEYRMFLNMMKGIKEDSW